jgi:hypothetical protein
MLNTYKNKMLITCKQCNKQTNDYDVIYEAGDVQNVPLKPIYLCKECFEKEMKVK